MTSPLARVLILGSLPGQISLDRGEYYANPQNAFWKIIGARITDLPTAYAGRGEALARYGIALWDVLAAATRNGSLDSAISNDAIPNNFRAYFHAHPHIQLICFNGSKASALFESHVTPTLTDEQRKIIKRTLPSTSGAHARLNLAQKTAEWSAIWTKPVERL